MPPFRPLAERFKEKCGAPTATGCIPWLGSGGVGNPGGHPTINGGKDVGSKALQAARVGYEMASGPIQEGRFVRLTCGNEKCVNPQHMVLLTKSEYLKKGTPEQLFGKHVGPPTPAGCTEWQGYRNECGYGVASQGGGHSSLAHRVAYRLFVGPIPPGMHVLHRCDNPACVNLDHLFLGTHVDNMADKKAKGRDAVGERVGSSRLTEKKVMEMRSLYAAGERSRCRLAKAFGVDPKTAWKVVTGRTWKHVGARAAA
jgi:hypothetical protein